MIYESIDFNQAETTSRLNEPLHYAFEWKSFSNLKNRKRKFRLRSGTAVFTVIFVFMFTRQTSFYVLANDGKIYFVGL